MCVLGGKFTADGVRRLRNDLPMALIKLVRFRSVETTGLESELGFVGEGRSYTCANRTSLELDNVGRVEKDVMEGRLEGILSDKVDSETEYSS